MSALFISPHDDDHALFGAFTCIRTQATVVVVYDSYVQEKRGLPHCSASERARETEEAAALLGCTLVYRLGLRDDVAPPAALNVIRARLNRGPGFYDETYAPAWEKDGHPQHNEVALAVQDGPKIQRYATYTSAGKTERGTRVPILDGAWIRQKFLALACYQSQMNLDPRMGCWPHFLRDQTEYYL